MANGDEFEERMQRWRSRVARPIGELDEEPAPRVTSEFITWVFQQEALEREKRDARQAGKFLMQVAIDRAAVHVSELHVSQWPMWVSYFLECLDSLGRERGLGILDLQEFLTKVHKMVAERVTLGSW